MLPPVAELRQYDALRLTNAAGADAAHARVFLSFYRGADNRQRLGDLMDVMTPEYLYG